MNASPPPNMLFIMADQHRFDYLGSAGADFVKTPHLDRLAERGIRFTQCTTNSPVCAPTRIALASGLQPWRVGAMTNASYLPHTVPTYYQRLRDYDYRVGCVGKLDLAKPEPYNGRHGDRPSAYRFGFTHPIECEGKIHAGNFPTPQGPYGYYLQELGLFEAFQKDYHRRRETNYALACEDSVLPTEAFADSYIGRRAAEWLDTIPDDYPWHLFVSFVGPHDPFDPPIEYADRYRNVPMPAPIPPDMTGKPHRVKQRQIEVDLETIAITRQQYCAAIALIDDHIGQIFAALERRGQLDNTYIIFASDHGEMLGDYGLYTKHLAYEASMRVPLIIAGPTVPQGTTSDALVELIDLNPTICELAGLPAQVNIDAQSIVPVLHQTQTEHRSETITLEQGYVGLRTRQHKYIETTNDVTELYDLENDPQERHNLIETHLELAAKLRERLRQRLTEGKWLR